MALLHALVLCGCRFALGSDVESMIQHALKSTESLHVPEAYSPSPFGAFVGQELLKRNLTVDGMAKAMERDFPFADEHANVPDMPAIMETFTHKATKAFRDSKEALKKTWEEFHTTANVSGTASPKQLLKQAKAAVLDTGLLSDISQAMLKLATSTVMPFFKTKYDSYVVGFDVSMGQWMRALGLPVMKGRGKIFVNWGFERDDIRVCVSAAADDSPTYVKWRHHKHPKQVGPNLFFGLAKWDDVPGWSFGTEAVLDMYAIDVEDIGMKWTLSEEPAPACFFLDICLFDSGFWKAVASLEQTDAEIEGAEIEEHPYPLDDPRSSYSALKVLKREWVNALAPTPPPRPPVKAAMFVERTWCNQDYVLEDEPLEKWRKEEAARIAAEEVAEATRTTTAAPTPAPAPPVVRVAAPSTMTTTTTVISGWHMGAMGESCDDTCAGLGENCDVDTLQGQTDAEIEGITAAIGTSCNSWQKSTRSDVPMPAQWTDGNCYHAAKQEYIQCDMSHSSAARLCACMPTTTTTTTTISTTTTTTATSTTTTTTTITTTTTTVTSTTTTSTTTTATTTTSTTTTTTTPYSPWNGVCPDGYFVEDQVIPSKWVDCPGTEAPGFCVLTRTNAEALCNSNPECAGIGEPSRTSGWGWSPAYVQLGKFPLVANGAWKSCMKGFAKIIVADGVATSRAFLSSTDTGDKVDLHTEEDGSGRQRWTLAKGSGDWYNIVIQGGISTGLKFLSTKSDGSMVDLHDKDDGSGRQRWRIQQGDGGWFTIQVFDGVSGGTFLSATSNGEVVDLFSGDDGSGRQRWDIPGMHPLDPPYASVLSPGTCSEHAWEPIGTAAGCEAAAVAMNYPHEGRVISVYHDTDERPPGL